MGENEGLNNGSAFPGLAFSEPVQCGEGRLTFVTLIKSFGLSRLYADNILILI